MIEESQISELKQLIENHDIAIKEEILCQLIKLRDQYKFTREDIENYILAATLRNKIEFDQYEIQLIKKNQEDKLKQKKPRNKSQINQLEKPQQNTTPQKPVESKIKPSEYFQSVNKSQLDKNFEQRIQKNTILCNYNPSQLPEPQFKHITDNKFKNANINDLMNNLGGNDQIFHRINMPECNEVTGRFENFLYNNLEFSDKALIERLIRFEEIYADMIRLQDKNFDGNFYDCKQITHDNVYLIGRITCDAQGRLTDSSIKFETKEKYSYILDIQKIQEYYLFPNQIIAVYGYINGEQGKFIVEKLYQDTFQCSQPEVEDGSKLFNSDDFDQYLIACGPYTQQDSIAYEPLNTLIEAAKEKQVENIILMGPFLDYENKIIQEGELLIQGNQGAVEESLSYEELFEVILKHVASNLDKNVNIYIQPSPQDMISYFPLPQENLSSSITNKKLLSRVQFLGNPSTIMISSDDNARFTFLSSNTALELMKNSITKGDKYQQDKLSATYQQFLNQRSSLPLYPSSDVINIQNAIRFGELELEDNDERFPNLIVLPSPLNPQAKTINETIFLNPGYICKGSQGGSYSILTFFKKQQFKKMKIK